MFYDKETSAMGFEERDLEIKSLKYSLKSDIEASSDIKRLLELYDDAYVQLQHTHDGISILLASLMAFLISCFVAYANHGGWNSFITGVFSIPVIYFFSKLLLILLVGSMEVIRENFKNEFQTDVALHVLLFAFGVLLLSLVCFPDFWPVSVCVFLVICIVFCIVKTFAKKRNILK